MTEGQKVAPTQILIKLEAIPVPSKYLIELINTPDFLDLLQLVFDGTFLVLISGHNLSLPVKIGLTDLPKSVLPCLLLVALPND